MIALRRGTPADAALLRAWDSKPHVIAATGADAEPESNWDWNWEHELGRHVPWRQFLIGEDDGRPVGVMQVIDPRTEETHYWGDIAPGLRAIDIWIGEESDLSRGYGAQMMRLAMRDCFCEPDVEAILIDPLVSNSSAHRFYQRLGFRRVDRRTFGGDDCYVYRLERKDWLG